MKVNLRVRERRDRQNVLGPVDTHVLLTHQTRCTLLVRVCHFLVLKPQTPVYRPGPGPRSRSTCCPQMRPPQTGVFRSRSQMRPPTDRVFEGVQQMRPPRTRVLGGVRQWPVPVHRTPVGPGVITCTCILYSDTCLLYMFVYYESRKRDLQIRLMNEGRDDERLKTRVEESTCLTYTGFHDKTN
jgi:hypothetical protein